MFGAVAFTSLRTSEVPSLHFCFFPLHFPFPALFLSPPLPPFELHPVDGEGSPLFLHRFDTLLYSFVHVSAPLF